MSLASCLQTTGKFASPVFTLPSSMLNWCFIAFCIRYFSWWKRFKAMMRWKDDDYIRVHRHRILKAKMTATLIVDLFPVKTTLLSLINLFRVVQFVNGLCKPADCTPWLTPNKLLESWVERQIRHFESHATKHESHAIITFASRALPSFCHLCYCYQSHFFLIKRIVLNHPARASAST